MPTSSITFYLQDPPPRFFWIAQSALSVMWIIQGSFGVMDPPDRMPSFPWFQLVGGSLLLATLAWYFMIQRKYGPPRIELGEEGIETKPKLRGEPTVILWRDISRIDLERSEIRVTTADSKAPVTIPLDVPFRVKQQIRTSLAERSAEKGVEIAGTLQ